MKTGYSINLVQMSEYQYRVYTNVNKDMLYISKNDISSTQAYRYFIGLMKQIPVDLITTISDSVLSVQITKELTTIDYNNTFAMRNRLVWYYHDEKFAYYEPTSNHYLKGQYVLETERILIDGYYYISRKEKIESVKVKPVETVKTEQSAEPVKVEKPAETVKVEPTVTVKVEQPAEPVKVEPTATVKVEQPAEPVKTEPSTEIVRTDQPAETFNKAEQMSLSGIEKLIEYSRNLFSVNNSITSAEQIAKKGRYEYSFKIDNDYKFSHVIYGPNATPIDIIIKKIYDDFKDEMTKNGFVVARCRNNKKRDETIRVSFYPSDKLNKYLLQKYVN